MRYVYPVALVKDENGEFIATSRDVPEAITSGTTESGALLAMSDALGAALAGYVLDRQGIPAPSDPSQGEYLVPVAALVAAKLALRSAMRAEGISNTELGRRLGVSEGAVRRLMDVDHASRMDGVIAALAALGSGIIIEDQRRTIVAA
ncbi:MAG: type II toxin-antitoxin system HicB family antitoxin [Acidithiobacillus sp.]